MKKQLLSTCLVLLTGFCVTAQPYQATWESLDKRPVPQWFTDSKFGIFIHWGVYSVPGWCTKGNYAEWYQQGLQTSDSARKAFHKAKFGDLNYYQLADQFKAELFNPDEWAKLFEQSGARYIVLTSKHHDGYTLWPNKDANRTWGFPWNAMDVGPKRDLLGDLFKAVRKTKVHAGMYYSLYEWFNPLWKSDPKKYAGTHVLPQMKELINTYQPEVFWTDGDWDASDETWKSKEFLAWLYNESPVKDKIVTYDRWGSGIRFKHGGVFTPEYQPDLDFEDHAWEESRGMGYSYGYNREEDAWDYNSTQSLIYHLLDKVSRGGNFLLDIGPDEHGKVPPIMQERLLQIGEWLKINGEAIYHTVRWKTTNQWSDGKRDYKAGKDEDIMMKLTVDPAPGYAVKEIFYTYNPVKNVLYATFPRYPSGRKLVLKDLPNNNGISGIRFLSTGAQLKYERSGNDITVQLPEYDPNKIKAPYAYTIAVEQYGAFTAKPHVLVNYDPVTMKATVVMETKEPGTVIQYTTSKSGDKQTYSKPFEVNEQTVIRATAVQAGRLDSKEVEATVNHYTLKPAVKTKQVKSGLSYRYYEAEKFTSADIPGMQPVKTGVAAVISVDIKQRKDKFAIVYEGYLKITETGSYGFALNSDDGSLLYIDDEKVVDNDGNHGSITQEGRCLLSKGYHKIKLIYFDNGGGNNLQLSYGRPDGNLLPVPAGLLFH